MPRSNGTRNVDSDLLDELFLANQDLQRYINEFGEDVPDPGDKLISHIDWIVFHIINGTESSILELESRNA